MTGYRYAYNNPIVFFDPFGLFETKKEARQYRKENKTGGWIKKEKDGSYEIHNNRTKTSYSTGDDSMLSNDDRKDGVIESVIVRNSSSHVAEDIVGVTGSTVDYTNEVLWSQMSTSQKSRFVYETRKNINQKLPININLKNSEIYRSKIPKGFKIVGYGGAIFSGVSIGYDIYESEQIKASHILDASMTAVSFIPGVGWVIGATYLGADILTRSVTGESIGDHLNHAVEENFDKKNGALLNF